jgi:tetratricopeptide (TPR) repeat protein
VLAAGCAGGGGAAQRNGTLPTLDAARRVRYWIPPGVAGDPASAGPAGTGDQLRYWVAQYMAQVGLPLAEDARHPYDVELHLMLSARGGSLLLHGTGAMLATIDGKAVDQWTTGDHVEPAGNFARAVARDLVEAMVHSTRLAAQADARSGGRAPAPEGAGTSMVIPAVAMSSGPAPAGGGDAPPMVTTDPAATPPRPPDTAAARAHARQGSAYYDLNRFREAYLEFEQAYLAEQDPALLYNMGQCQRKLGNSEEALHFYRTYLRRAPNGPSSAEAEKRVHEIEDAMAHGRK